MFLGIFSRFFNTLLWPDPKPVYAFALVDSTADVHIPSDLEGISLATYTPHASGNIQAAVGPACARIKQSIRQLGLKANGSTLGDVPGDLFWLGHDLSLAIRNNSNNSFPPPIFFKKIKKMRDK